MRIVPAIALCAPLAGAACGPVSVEQAERACFEQVRQSRPLSGTAAIGISNDGFINDIDVQMNLSSNQGRDPAEVYASCVYRRSGQLPRRPLYDRPDWRG